MFVEAVRCEMTLDLKWIHGETQACVKQHFPEFCVIFEQLFTLVATKQKRVSGI